MGKKKFIDKKKAATFQLMARDTSDPNYSADPSGDRVFVRIDNSEYAPPSSLNDEAINADQGSIFGDAPEDHVNCSSDVYFDHKKGSTSLPDHIRKELLELGYPDDGYNYLMHLREIRDTGGGSGYYANPKARVDMLPRDVKAYDASRVEVPNLISGVPEDKSLYSVASKQASIRLQKALDPEVAARLDDDDSSKFASDVEDLEDDFVIVANKLDRPTSEEIVQVHVTESRAVRSSGYSEVSAAEENEAAGLDFENEEKRVRRPLDEQFDLLELHEYGSEDEDDYNGCIDEFDAKESLGEKLSRAFKDPSSFNVEKDDQESPELTAEVIRKCREYAEKYEDENDDDAKDPYEDSSDESEVWDCETIVSTYSTLDNHPGKIVAPESKKKKNKPETLLGTSSLPVQKIALKGKESIPIDFLPRRGIRGDEKMKDEKGSKPVVRELQNKKPRSLETREEKKERKSAVKSERREARRMKKETKDLYKYEAHHAQKVAAGTGPASIPLN